MERDAPADAVQSQNPLAEQLPLVALYHVALHREDHFGASLRRGRDYPGAPCPHGDRLERGVVLADEIPSAYNHWDQMASNFADAPYGAAPRGAVVVPCGAVPYPGTGEGHAAEERVVAGRKRYDDGCRMAVHLPSDLASACKEAVEKVRQR